MANDPVKNIYGIGPVTSEALRTQNVTTVGQLAALAEGELSVPNLGVLIRRAQEYVKSRTTPAAPSTDTDKLMVLSGATLPSKDLKSLTRPKGGGLFVPKVSAVVLPVVATAAAAVTPHPNQPAALAVADKSAEDKELYMIADHTWFETRVVVPSEDALREAIVYELGVEPNDRVAFVCTWVTTEPGQEKLHTMTYSPQLLLHFNLELPPLRVSVREEDFQTLPNRHTLTNALWEVEMMQRRMQTSV